MSTQKVATGIGLAALVGLLTGVGLPVLLPPDQVPAIQIISPAAQTRTDDGYDDGADPAGSASLGPAHAGGDDDDDAGQPATAGDDDGPAGTDDDGPPAETTDHPQSETTTVSLPVVTLSPPETTMSPTRTTTMPKPAVMTGTTESPVRPWRGPFGLGLRLRLLGWALALLAVASLASVVVIRQVLLNQLENRIATDMRQEVTEFARLVGGRDPDSGQPFGPDLRAIADTYLDRNEPQTGEAVLVLVDGAFYRATEAPPYDLSRDAALMRRWVGLTDSTYGQVEQSPGGPAHWLAVPVIIDGAVRGQVVVVEFRAERRAEIDRAVRMMALACLLVIVVVAAGGYLAMGRALRPLRTVTETARTIEETDLSRRIEVTGTDEVADLAHTFNGMLGRLHRAFAAQQAFVSDAGHELRTPITIVRGHLELMGDDPADRAETIALVTDELDRMNRMVNDLLMLAKAEQPDFLHPDHVEVDLMMHDVYAKAVALGDRDWRIGTIDEVTVWADRQRLTQALMQLAQNAVQFTAPVTPSNSPPRRQSRPGEHGPGAARRTGHRGRHRTRGPGADLRPVRPGRPRPGARRGFRARPGHRGRDRRGAPGHGRGGQHPGCRIDLHPGPARQRGPARNPWCRAMNRVLIAEDEPRIASFLTKGLRAAGYVTTVVTSGVEVAVAARSGDFDVLILDLGLPGQDGLAALAQIRARGERLPVIVLTARDAVPDRVAGLDLGADDYMTKPFSFDELLARVRARLREHGQATPTVVQAGPIRLDLVRRTATVNGDLVELTGREFLLAETLLRHPGQVLSREQLLDRVWGLAHDPGSNVVDVYIGYLRRKLGTNLIQTVRGIGYRLAG